MTREVTLTAPYLASTDLLRLILQSHLLISI